MKNQYGYETGKPATFLEVVSHIYSNKTTPSLRGDIPIEGEPEPLRYEDVDDKACHELFVLLYASLPNILAVLAAAERYRVFPAVVENTLDSAIRALDDSIPLALRYAQEDDRGSSGVIVRD